MAAQLSADRTHQRARVAALSRAVRAGERPASDLDDARRDYRTATLADYIERTLAAAPPLTDEQRTRLAELLRPSGQFMPDSRRTVIANRLAELDGGAA